MVYVVFCVFSEFYEPGAMLMEDEGIVIAGLLVGLNVIDCNLGIKDEDLDQPVCYVFLHMFKTKFHLIDSLSNLEKWIL